MSYRVNEIFYSLQGEGMRAGTPNVFVRFSGCNLTCRVETHGFDCDTEFVSGRTLSLEELLEEIKACFPQKSYATGPQYWVILTGGEPALQIDDALIQALASQHWYIAVETNGSIELPAGIPWVTVSPKVAEHAVRQLHADEVKYVRSHGQGIPKPKCKAKHKLISPAFNNGALDQRDLEWCIQLVKENPTWRLSVQQHKAWKVR